MDRQVFYINYSVVVSSAYDVHLIMKSVSPIINNENKQEGINVNDDIEIIMSIEHAKAFLKAMTTNFGKNESVKEENAAEIEDVEKPAE